MCDYTNDSFPWTATIEPLGQYMFTGRHRPDGSTHLDYNLGGWRARKYLGRDKTGSTELEGGGHFVSSAH